jgi:hypothetical protein
MEVDPMEAAQRGTEPQPDQNQAIERLNTRVAITVAILATFMGICKVKDDNIVQAMQQAQANKIDHWAFYQARHLREELAHATIVQLQLAAATGSSEAKKQYEEAIAHYQALANEQNRKKGHSSFSVNTQALS